jgi:hypothetical protein
VRFSKLRPPPRFTEVGRAAPLAERRSSPGYPSNEQDFVESSVIENVISWVPAAPSEPDFTMWSSDVWHVVPASVTGAVEEGEVVGLVVDGAGEEVGAG